LAFAKLSFTKRNDAMFKRLLLPGSALLILLVLCLSCSDRNEPEKLCGTCPEIDPAYAAAFEYIEDNREQIGLRPDIDELMPYRSGTDQLGMTHIRFYQHYRGVRVIGGEIIIHLDTDLKVIRHNGLLVEGIDINHRPQLTSDTALSVAQQHFESLGFTGSRESGGGLMVLRVQDTDYLCWNLVMRDNDNRDIIEYFIDANNAGVVQWRSMIIIG
jgi:Zn-dependent metalloprotease